MLERVTIEARAVLPPAGANIVRGALAEAIRVCRSSRSLSEAGRTLFAASRLRRSSANDADRILEDANKQAASRVKEADLEAKEKLLQMRSDFDKKAQQRQDEIKAVERRLQQKEEALDKKTGRVKWQQTAYKGVPKIKPHTKATHANSTLATDGERLIAFFGSEGV